jgi:hypothetical protein
VSPPGLYLSFSDETGWLGAVYAPGYQFDQLSVLLAIQETWDRKCNPGGEIQAVQLTTAPTTCPPWKLLTEAEVQEHFGPTKVIES